VDRATLLPHSLVPSLEEQLRNVRKRDHEDLQEGAEFVELPTALRLKYPNAAREWSAQWVFPASRRYVDDSTGELRRHHSHETVLQRHVRDASMEHGDVTQPERR